MNAVKVDEAKRVRLKIMEPGDYYEPEYTDSNIITLRKVPPPPRPKKMTRSDVLQASKNCKLKPKMHWQELRKRTREP